MGREKTGQGSPSKSVLLELCFVADVCLDLENLKAQDACWKGLVAVRGQVSVAMWNHPQDDLTSIGGELTKDKQPCTMHFVHGPDVAWHTAACSWLLFC